jgi:regulation of enolase protein 1 (concanavalin A-like superfamily)
MTDIAWTSGTWTTAPAHVVVADDGMRVTAVEGSDAWRVTAYGFVHDTEHALLAPFAPDTATEVSFRLDFTAQFDQAGIFVKVDEDTWTKSGVERSDGVDSLGAVVTRGVSDWSLAPVPDWHGRIVTIRASRSGDALTVRARVDDEPWRLVRVAPLDPDARVTAGPMCCAPSRGDLTVHFTAWRTGPADVGLHPGD